MSRKRKVLFWSGDQMISSHIIQRLGGAITKLLGNRFSIINAAPPASTAGILKGGPEAGVVREIGVDADLGVEVTSHEPFEITEVVDASRKVHGIDADADGVAVTELSDRASGESFGADVTDAGTSGDTGKPTIGDKRDLLADLAVFQGRGHLVGLWHAGSPHPRSDRPC